MAHSWWDRSHLYEYLLQEYFHYIALPIIVASGVISALWAIKALGQAHIVKLKKGLDNVNISNSK